MEYLEIRKFPGHSNLFYDYINKSNFYIHHDRLFVSGTHKSLNLSPYSKYISRPIIGASLSSSFDTLALQTKSQVVHLVSTASVCASKIKCKANVLGFFFSTSKTKSWDLLVITNQNIQVYVLEKELKSVLKHQNNINIDSYICDPGLGYLATISSNNLILFSIKNKDKKPQQISKFQVGQPIAQSLGSSNLFTFPQAELDSKIISIGLFYDKVYLVSLDGFNGTLTLLKKDSVKYSFDIDPGAYNVRVIDNLIVLHNFGLQESTIIDRLHNPISFKVNHRGTFELNPSFVQIDQKLSFDLASATILELRLNPQILKDQIQNPSESIIFLLRREKSLTEGLALLKSYITQEKNIEAVLKRIVKGEDNIKSVAQSQILNQVILPCSKEAKDLKFLSKILVIYIRELIFADIKIHQDIQISSVKVLIKANELLLLQDLLSYHIIDDSQEIAQLMIELSRRRKFSYGFMLGIDMLCRLRLNDMVMDQIIANGEFYDVAGIGYERPCRDWTN